MMKLGINEFTMHHTNKNRMFVFNKEVSQLVKDNHFGVCTYSNGKLFLTRKECCTTDNVVVVLTSNNGGNVIACSVELVRLVCAWFAVGEGSYRVSYELENGFNGLIFNLLTCTNMDIHKQEQRKPTEQECIDLLKSLGYKIMKPITQYEEV